MSDFEIILLPCEYNGWAVNPFIHLFEKFYPDTIVNIFSEKNYLTISNKHRFIKLPSHMLVNDSCPRGKFSDSLIFALNNISSKHAIVMLTDYWLYNTVDINALANTSEYMENNPDVLRADVGSQHIPKGLANITPDLMESLDNRNVFYPVSLCPAMWNKENYLPLLQEGLDPWQTEIIPCEKFLGQKQHGNKFTHLRTLWSHPGPIKYFNALRGRDDVNMVMRREVIDEIKHFIPPRFSYGFEN